MKKKNELLAAIKAYAINNRGLTREKATMKYRCADRQGIAYRQEMMRLTSARKQARHCSRVALLAYGFVRGRDYARIEANARLLPSEVRALAHQVANEAQASEDEVSLWFAPRGTAEAA
jgi:hypothetical protein